NAVTGAHEVINTIMLNYIALRFVDLMINSTNPYIMRDPNATNPATPNVHPDAVLPRFSEIGTWWFFVAAALMLALGLYQNREYIRRDARAAIRPVINALLVLA